MRKLSNIATASFIASAICIGFLTPTFAQSQKYSSKYSYKKYTPKSSYSQTYKQPTQSYSQQQGYSYDQVNSQGPVQAYQGYNQGYNPNYNNLPPLQGRVVTIPAGTPISAVTTSEISSEYITVGDTISFVLPTDFYYNGALVLPANSVIEGNAVIAEKAGLAGKNGKLKIRFTNAITPNGQRVPISGKLMTEDGSGILTGGTNLDRIAGAAKKSAVGAGVGALAGTVLGPLSGGKVGKGAIYGTAVGGGLGLGKSLIDKGYEVVIPANEKLDIMLEQPMTVSPGQSYNY